MTDGAAIYMLGFQPRSDVSHNLIKDVWNGNGLYGDEGSCELLFEGNVVDGVGLGDAAENMGHGYYQHLNSRDVKVVNNLFMRCRNELIGRRELEPLGHLALTVAGNIFVSSGPVDSEVLWQDGNEFERRGEYKFEKNCYYRTDDSDMTFMGMSWKSWQAMGNDRASHLKLNSKPVFVDPEHASKNYLLKQAPCLEQIGFKQLKVQKAGRYRIPE
jgi:hypothetical protein